MRYRITTRHTRAVHRIGAVGAVLALLTAGACTSHHPAPKLPVGVVIDAGFRPGDNGLPFQNYGAYLHDGSAPTNLTADDLRRMFGDAVCADASIGRCDLIPPAKAWMDATNQLMSGGHCYGFAVAADLLWQRRLSPNALGAPTTPRLDITGNQALQRTIAYDWAMQLLDSVRSERVTGSPNKILDTLTKVLTPHPKETYTLVFFKADRSAGHAVTPYAVKHEGGGRVQVLIYDNNWPGKQRAITFDTKADTWTYDAAVNPNEPAEIYRGDAETKTIMLYPTSPGLGRQPCPFCDKVPAAGMAAEAGAATKQEVFLLGGIREHADLLITDDHGRRIGYVNGHLVDDIAQSSIDPVISAPDWRDDIEPELVVPADRRYTVTVEGSSLKHADTETLGVIGPSSELEVRNIRVRPGETDRLVVDRNATRISYTSSRRESPTLQVGVNDRNADYTFDVAGVAESPGNAFELRLPPEGGRLTMTATGRALRSRLTLTMTRESERGVAVFRHTGIDLRAGESATLRFGEWPRADAAIPLVTTRHGHRTTHLLRNEPRR